MEFLMFYYILLMLWVPLVWPAVRLRGIRRWVLAVVVLVGALATLSEIWQAFLPPNAIRVDVLFFTVVLCILYAIALAVLLSARWQIFALQFGLVLALVAGGAAFQWFSVVEEGKRVRAAVEERDYLLFRAKFRDEKTYEAYFGPFTGEAGGYPAGHWQGPDTSPFPRLIVNAIGQVWLFFRCGKTECAYGPTNELLEPFAGGATRAWRGLLRPPVGDLLPVTLEAVDDDTVSLAFRDQRLTFNKAPPPIAGTPPDNRLAFVGPYMSAECIGKHAAVRQVWLWRQGERLFAVGVFQTLLAGRRALFVPPSVMGEGRREGAAWAFAWGRDGRAVSATLGVDATTADSMTLQLKEPGRETETVGLKSGALFGDETILLAPRTNAEDWKHWFDTVWVGHFFSGQVPACP